MIFKRKGLDDEKYLTYEGSFSTSVYRMNTYDGRNWRVHIQQLPSNDIKVFHYYYSVEKDAKVIKSEWQMQTHLFYLNTLCGKSYEVFDILDRCSSRHISIQFGFY